MTQGLYEQIGAHRGASRDDLESAYTRAVAQLVRRRKALVEQGGDTGRLDLSRAQTDEAWAVLSDPVRRRRYDALLVLTEHGSGPQDARWEQVAGALASPAAVAAVELVGRLTRLDVGVLPGLPSAQDEVEAEERTAGWDTQAQVPTEAMPGLGDLARPMPAEPPSVVRLPASARPAPTPATSDLRVVDGRPGNAPVVVLPSAGMRGPGAVATPSPAPAVRAATPAPAGDLGALVESLGWSGALIRTVRERRGQSVRDLGDATRISARYLEAIESDDFDHLPSATFVKGYLREIARTLGLDEDGLVRGYMRRLP